MRCIDRRRYSKIMIIERTNSIVVLIFTYLTISTDRTGFNTPVKLIVYQIKNYHSLIIGL